MRKILSKIFTSLGIILMIMGLIFSTFTRQIYAEDLEIIGRDAGLVLEPPGSKLFDLQRLNPGDSETAKLTIRNNYRNPFNLYMRAERTSPLPDDGIDLFDILQLTVVIRGQILYQRPIKDFATSNIDLGRFNRNANEELVATIELSGPDTGNGYQGKTVDVKWIFLAESIESPREPREPEEPWEPPIRIDIELPKGSPEEIEEVEEPEEEEEEVIEIEEEIPMGEAEPPEETIVEIETEPAKGGPKLPKTGELPLSLYYVSGMVMLALGIGLNGRKRK